VNADRAAFEIWATDKGLPLDKDDAGNYTVPLTAENWKLRERQAKAFSGEGEVPAYWISDSPVMLASTPCYTQAWNVPFGSSTTPLYRHPTAYGAVPNGYALVPVEPTIEMMDAAESAAWATKDQLGPNADFDTFMHAFVYAQWRAALKIAVRNSQQATNGCEYCNGAGDVHRADGEWMGECTVCQALKDHGHALASTTEEKKERVAQMLWHRFAHDHRMEWEDETHKADYRSAAALIIEALK
jgi:hypothetical protein